MSFLTPFKEAIDYFRQKVRQPTKHWRDLEGRTHDRAFVIAGATKDAFLNDMKDALIDALKNGKRLEEFANQFEAIVAKHGWTGWTGEKTPKGRAWRARVIFETNIRTAYAAGRWKQMTDPKLVKVRPFWQYKHGFLRTPKMPRKDHVALDGIVLDWNNPIWRVIYPPNGWGCSCGVQPLSRRQLERLGKTGPDETPVLTYRKVKDPKTGETLEVPNGISFGWDHAPGANWASGLIPPELQDKLNPLRSASDPLQQHPLRDIAQPSNGVGTLPEGKPAEYYVDAILALVGAKRGENGAVLIRDKAGYAIPVGEAMFKTATGKWKSLKRGRAQNLLKAFQALIDPDEIWVDFENMKTTGRQVLRRRYLRFEEKTPAVGVFEWGQDGWSGTTLFPVDDVSSGKREKYIENQRHGQLLYRRPTKKGNS
ncbi:PBECR2 nuclease fold domain-containing protein [Bartonella apis]|uniref:PBECR2 nuclease fold domain-containing protein n=1 Tax=Bartonella apis TaxID=1686310 RepID=UPI0018DC7EAE|nr:PBECR2 nuclease fold domain-containing protein [Bartonella apis]MBI0177572.1 head morphogenesis protein [Bartonella apis]